MSVLSAKRVTCLTLGDPVLDGIFPGFELGEFAVLLGDAASFVIFVLSVRCQMLAEYGGLNSPVVFVDGGNSFSPYLVAEIAQGYNLDPKSTLEKIYVSRAFTAYQFSALILEKLEAFLKRKRAKLLVVSDISSLFFDKDMHKTEAKDLFMKVCAKLSEISVNRQIVVVASYFPERKYRQGVFFDVTLFGRSNVLVRFKRVGKILHFALEDHPRIRSFNMDFSSDYTPLTVLTEA